MSSKISREVRKKLIDACLVKQRSLMDDFKARIRALTESAGLGNEESYDNTDRARSSANAEEINVLNEQLEFAARELNVLENLQATQQVDHTSVALGAIVVTNRITFFISVSIEQFTVDGHSYFGVSTHSPIFKQMEGKKKGDTFRFQDTAYTIRDII